MEGTSALLGVGLVSADFVGCVLNLSLALFIGIEGAVPTSAFDKTRTPLTETRRTVLTIQLDGLAGENWSGKQNEYQCECFLHFEFPFFIGGF
jgi:hypothetical protein